MDPNLFHIDWERTLEALVSIIILSFVVERVCALLFESRWWIGRFEDARVGISPGSPANPENPAEGKAGAKKTDAKKAAAKKADEESGEEGSPPAQKPLPGQRYPLKEILAFILALGICWTWNFDAPSIILLSGETHFFGYAVTAGVVAGGSKASIALFHSVMGIRSQAQKERQALRDSD